jgi:hypothetical protein
VADNIDGAAITGGFDGKGSDHAVSTTRNDLNGRTVKHVVDPENFVGLKVRYKRMLGGRDKR